MRFNEAQLRLYQTYRWFRDHRRPVRIVICKARRAGLSTGVEALIYDDTVTNPNTYSLIVANEKNPSENVLGMCRRFWQYTPQSVTLGKYEINVRPPLPPQFNNNPPKDRMEFAEPLASRIFVATARSIDAYLGYGFQNMHATEAAYYQDGHELFRALYPTLSTDAHSALYVESTPNGQQGRGAWFYEQCMDAMKRRDTDYGEMRLVFIPWQEMTYSFAIPFGTPEKRAAFGRTLNDAEKNLLKRFPAITLEQLQWRRMILAGPTFNKDEDLFDQEYPTDVATAFLMTGISVFGRKQIKRLSARTREPIWQGDVYWGESDEKNEREPIHELMRRPCRLTKGQAIAKGFKPHTNERYYNNLRVFRWPRPGERIIVTADVGGGNPETKDGDWSTMCVGVLNELSQDELIMTWRGHLNPIAFGEVAAALCWLLRYMVGPDVVAPELAPEWTGPGVGMCTYIDKKNLYPNLYRYQQPGVHNMPASKHIGWESNAKTKPIMIAYTLRMIERDLIDVPDAELVTEMSSYRQTDLFGDEGSYGGAAGRHDDLVSAFQILCALLRLRSATIPGDAPVEYVDMAEQDEEDVPFDPFSGDTQVLPGILERDVDDESLEESGWWAS